MSNLLKVEDVRQAHIEEVSNEFPMLEKSMHEQIADHRMQEALVKGMQTTGIVAQGGTTGADATKVEDLSSNIALQALGARDCATFNMLSKKPMLSDVIEFITTDSVGEIRGGGYVDPLVDTGSTIAMDGQFLRRTLRAGYYARQFQTFVNASAATSVGFAGTPRSGMADENNRFMATQAHCRNLNWATLHGNTALNDLEPQGLIAQIESVNDPAYPNVIDMDGQPFTPEKLADIGGQIYRNTGLFTDFSAGVNVLADFQKQLSERQRSGFGDRVGMLSYPDATLVQGLGGDPTKVKLHRDIDLDAPNGFDGGGGNTGAPTAPTSVVPAVSAGTLNWRGKTGLPAGTYYYSVKAFGATGESTATAASAQVVANGDKVTLTITRGSANTREYRVYRGTTAGKREYLGRVKTTGATDVFVDNNEIVPGTSQALALTIAPFGNGQMTVQNRIYIPTQEIELPRALMALNRALLTGFAPQVYTPRQQVVIKNIGRYTG